MNTAKATVIYLFVCTAGVVLMTTGAAKLISSCGNAHLLEYPDPLLYLSFRYVLLISGIIELAIASVCFYGRQSGLQAAIIAWFATGLLVYRIGLFWIGWRKPCICLGNLTDELNVSSQTADTAMKVILAYLLIGSYATLFWYWRHPPLSAQLQEKMVKAN
jgi:hypothetical protein